MLLPKFCWPAPVGWPDVISCSGHVVVLKNSIWNYNASVERLVPRRHFFQCVSTQVYRWEPARLGITPAAQRQLRCSGGCPLQAWLSTPLIPNSSTRRYFGGRGTRSTRGDSEGAPEGYSPRATKFIFDKHRLVAYLRRRKRELRQSEFTRQLDTIIPDPPDGWDVARFIRRVGFNQDHEESFVKAFPDWKSLMLWDPIMAEELVGTEAHERRRLRAKIQQLLHGLWPPEIFGVPAVSYRPPPLKEERKPWKSAADKQLLSLATKYDVSFGYPWLYISWEMQRTEEDVHQRYVELAKKPESRKQQWDLVLHKSTRPLRMNRKFRIDPPFLFIVPSRVNFPPCTNTSTETFSNTSRPTGFIPRAFLKFQRPDCFAIPDSLHLPGAPSPDFEWQVGPHQVLGFWAAPLTKGVAPIQPTGIQTQISTSRNAANKLVGTQLFEVPVSNDSDNAKLPQSGPLWREVTVTHLPRLRRPYPFRKKIQAK